MSLYRRLELVYTVANERFKALVREKCRSHADYCENLAKLQLWRGIALEASFGMREIERGKV